MKGSREELNNLVSSSIRNIARKNLIKDTLEKYDNDQYTYKRIYRAKMIQILQDSLPIMTLSVENLCNLTKFLANNKLISVDPNNYFTDAEFEAAVNDEIFLNDKYDEFVTFENVIFNDNEYEEEYVCVLDYKTIAEMYESGVFDYNFATQRMARFVKINGITERIADINIESVYAIKARMQEKGFHMNAITLNMLVNGEEEFKYNPNTRELIVSRRTKIDEIDGYHRTKAIHLAWKENPKLEGKMVVMIKHLTVEQARDYIAQESCANMLNRETMKLYSSEGAVSKLTSLINSNKRKGNILRNRISDGNDNQETLIYDGIFYKNLNEAWEETIDKASTRELAKISNFICDFYSGVYETICEIFKVDDINDLKNIKDSVALDMTLMAGFLYPAHKMYIENGQVDFEKIDDIVHKINLDTEYNNKFIYKDDRDKTQFKPYKSTWMSI